MTEPDQTPDAFEPPADTDPTPTPAEDAGDTFDDLTDDAGHPDDPDGTADLSEDPNA